MDTLENRLCPYFADEKITDILLSPDSLKFDRGSGIESVDWKTSEEELKIWVLQMLGRMGRSFDAKTPFNDGIIETSNGPFRFHSIFPPLTRQGTQISLRRLPRSGSANIPKFWRLDPHYEFLKNAVLRSDNMIVCGSTGSGKTTLINELLSELPQNERVISLEDTPELSPALHGHLSLLSRPPNADGFGEISLRSLLKQTLRMRPDRIVLGECRGEEVLDLLQALNTGHRGTLATLHASSAREGVKRLELLCLLSGSANLSLSAIRELIALSIRFIVFVERGLSGRKIREIIEISGREGDTLLFRSHVLKSVAQVEGIRSLTNGVT